MSGADGRLDCERVLARVSVFLDRELDEASSDEIRLHLAECEECLDEFDAEAALKALVNRCCSGERAPESLKARLRERLGR